MNNLENKLEALLFVSGDGVEISEIIDKWQVTDKQLDKAFENLKAITLPLLLSKKF